MKNNPFAVAQKYLDHTSLPTHPPEVVEANQTIQAVKITSTVLGDDIWLILDRSFIPHDGLATYYPEELCELKKKTPEDIREIHKYKLIFPGARVIQEGAEKREDGQTR